MEVTEGIEFVSVSGEFQSSLLAALRGEQLLL